MPPVSEKQRRAMWAAAEGRSNLGIPRSVGKEFVGKDGAPLAAGIVFVAPDGEVLLLRRASTEENYAGHWALPGGKADGNESAEEAALREASEECGIDASPRPMRLMDRAETPNGMVFHTFACPVDEKFVPKLNGEHSGYAWAGLDALPHPMHPQVQRVLGEHLGVAGDMTPEDWETLRSTFAKWTREEEQEGEHAEDEGAEGNATGKLSQKEEAVASKTRREREEMPAHAFLEVGERKFPVKEERDGKWVYSRNLLLAAARRARMAGNQKLAEHADAIRKREFDGAQDERIAFDRKSVRTFDTDGHMHVARTPISKANVCEYYGYEIPDADKLGLDPQRRYKLLRDPDELAKAAASSNGKPLLIKHVPTSADDHQTDAVVGAVGTDAKFEHPYLYNSLSVWDGDAIEGIKDETQKELSSAYRYRADMTPGTYEGVPYDGVMRDIQFNHVALVPEGRAGADVVVGDSKPKGKILMSKTVLTRKGTFLAGAVAAYLMPKLAQDAKFDVEGLFTKVTAKNFKSQKGKIAEYIRQKAVLAQDADLEDLNELLDRLDEHKVVEGADIDPSSGLPLSAEEAERKKAADEAEEEERKKKEAEMQASDRKRARDEKLEAYKKEHGLDEKACAALDELMGDLDGMDGEEEAATLNAEGKDRKTGKDSEPKVSKAAMDAALEQVRKDTAREVMKTANEIAEAKDFAARWVGRLAMDAMCSADVYKLALDHLGVDTAGVHPTAYRKILEVQPLPGSNSRVVAQDAAPDRSGFSARFGSVADRINIAG